VDKDGMFSPSLSQCYGWAEDLEADQLLEELLQSCPPASLDPGAMTAMTAEGLPSSAWWGFSS